MAVCEIWDVRGRLDHPIDYAQNPEKTANPKYSESDLQALVDVMEYATNQNKTITDDKAEQRFFVTGVNCDPATAREELMIAKQQWNDESKIVCYHGFQSFKHGEITPEVAHEVGVKLAERMWGDRFQVIVATHLNTECLHNHFVVNSVSFVDGKHYHDNKKNLRLFRRRSDELCSADAFRQYLDVQGRFDRYSVNNAILVSAQMPEATQLKEKAAWKQSRTYVNKDARKIVILEPSKEYTRDDGTKAVGYNAKEVYDVSDTSAKDRQQPQEGKSIRELVSAMIDASPVGFQPVEELEVPAFYDGSQQTIFIRTGLSEEQLFVSMSKEVAAAVFDFKYNENRDASEFKSFCVAYMVSSRYGVDTRGFQFGKLPKEYEGMDTQAFKGELGSMRDVMGEIQSDMYKSMEKNKPPKSKEQER